MVRAWGDGGGGEGRRRKCGGGYRSSTLGDGHDRPTYNASHALPDLCCAELHAKSSLHNHGCKDGEGMRERERERERYQWKARGTGRRGGRGGRFRESNGRLALGALLEEPIIHNVGTSDLGWPDLERGEPGRIVRGPLEQQRLHRDGSVGDRGVRHLSPKFGPNIADDRLMSRVTP